jgi:hypothetical protein
MTMRQGRQQLQLEAWNGKGPMEVVGLAARRIDKWKPDYINIDCTGIGSGIADRLIELGYPVTRIHFGERAVEEKQYMRRRDEMWGEMAKWFTEEHPSILLDDALAADLTGPQYSYDSSRRLILERKEDMKKRGVKSPDRGDALALTFAVPASSMGGDMRVDRSRGRSWRT